MRTELIRRVALASLLLTLAGRSAAAQGQDIINRRDQARGSFLVTAAGTFGHYCAHCHGDDGRGGGRLWASDLEPAPPDLTASALDAEELERFIADGSAAFGRSNLCPPWGATLGPTVFDRLVRHISTLSGPTTPLHETDEQPAKPMESRGFPWGLLLILVAETAILLWMRHGWKEST